MLFSICNVVGENLYFVFSHVKAKFNDDLLMGKEHTRKIIPDCSTPSPQRMLTLAHEVSLEDKINIINDDPKFGMFGLFKYQLKRGENGLEVYIMCELPSNVMEAEEFSPLVDGVSIGGNDLLQLTVGLDRDNEKLTQLTDHTNLSYRRMISQAISIYKKNGVKVGFCGQQPSDSVEFCQFLINEGTDSISVTPDSVLHTLNNI